MKGPKMDRNRKKLKLSSLKSVKLFDEQYASICHQILTVEIKIYLPPSYLVNKRQK